MKEIVILGAGDFAKEVIWLIEDINAVQKTYSIVGCLDDDEGKLGIVYKDYRCLGPIDMLQSLSMKTDVFAVVAMQSTSARKAIVNRFPEFSRWETLVHPTVNIADTSTVGVGSVLCAGVVVGVCATIGNHCLFNIRSTIGHDCILGDYISVMSGSCVSGHVTIDDGAYLATNCTVVPGRKIGASATVGAGSVAIRNVRSGSTVMGVPAKVIKF